MTNLLRCAHVHARVEDYDEDSYRWVARCRDCGEVVRYTQREWRSRPAGAPSPAPAGDDLLRVDDEAGE